MTSIPNFRLLSAVDLSRLPPPDVVDLLDVEAIVADMLQAYNLAYPEFSAVVESEPVLKLIEVFAYRELLVRQRINDAARATMVATALGSDLDNQSAILGVTRIAGESDDRLRARTVLAVEAFSGAGPVGAYRYHALTAAPSVKDVTVVTPSPGQVLITLLGSEGAGHVAADVVDAVQLALNAENVRPLTDQVSVRSPEIVNFAIDAGLFILPGPEAEPFRARSEASCRAYLSARHLLGADITLSGVLGSLHVDGIQRVVLREPTGLPIVTSPQQAAFASGVVVVVDGRDE
jgi:phage-related baseplate assembly protein